MSNQNMQLPQLIFSQEQQLGYQGIQIFVACDPNYLKEHAIVLAHSLEQNSPKNSLHLHVFGYDQYVANQIKVLKESLKDTYITWSYEKIAFGNKESQAVYCSCVRFIRLTQLIQHFKLPILSLDADSLVINSLDQLKYEMASSDVALITRFHLEPIQFKFLTSSVLFTPTENTFKFLNHFSQLIWNAIESGQSYWYLDQVSFYQACQNLPNLKIKDISAKYADWEFHESSCIWAGKGQRKYHNEKYVEKIKKIKGLLYDVNPIVQDRIDIINIFRADATNVGDWYSSPARYLPLFSKNYIDIFSIKEIPTNKIFLIGGGGLISPSFKQLEYLLNSKDRIKIGWGLGHNMVADKKAGGYVPPCDLIYPTYLKNFDLLGIRDDVESYNWVPCASCFYGGFTKKYPIKHEIVIFEHKRVSLGINGYPIMNNSGNDIDAVLQFLGSGEVVITNSYHGAYWATLLGKRVVAIPFSSKFYGFKHKMVFSKPHEWKKNIDKTVYYSNALFECRQANLQFFMRVEKLLQELNW